MNDIIVNKTNTYFPKALVYIGYAMIAYGLILIFLKTFIGALLIIIGVYLGLSFDGIQIDTKKREFKKYSSFFGLKKGIWKSYINFPFLTILTVTEKETGYSRGQVEFTSKKKVYRICLLNKTHREKIILKNLKNKDQAINYASEMVERLEVEQTIYNPEVSAGTRLKRK